MASQSASGRLIDSLSYLSKQVLLAVVDLCCGMLVA